MKTLININFYTQWILVVLITASLLGSIMDSVGLFFALILQFLTGCIQLLFSYCFQFGKLPKNSPIKRHFLLSLLAILLIIASMMLQEFVPYRMLKNVIGSIILFAIPWVLAVYYWVISWKMKYGKA